MNLKYFLHATLPHFLDWRGYLLPWILASLVLIGLLFCAFRPPVRLKRYRRLCLALAVVLIILGLWYWYPKWQFSRDTSIRIPSHYTEQEKKDFLDRRTEVLTHKDTWGRNNSGLYNSIGIIRSGLKDYAGAVDSFKKAIQKNPDDPRFWRNLAITYSYQDKYKESEDAFLHVFKAAPTTPDYWLELGELYQFKLKDNAKARSFYLEALSRTNQNISVAQAFANFLETQEKSYAEAIIYWQIVADGVPANNKIPFLAHIEQLKQQHGIK